MQHTWSIADFLLSTAIDLFHINFSMYKYFFKPVLLIPVLLSATQLFAQTPVKNNPPPDFSTVEALINEDITQRHIPSISIAIVYKGQMMLEKSFGWADRENHIKATIHTPYYLASVTKTITTTALAKLAAQKLLDWDKPVNNYLGSAHVQSPLWNASKATVRNVATHTSGLTTYDRDCYPAESGCIINMDTVINRYGILFSAPGEHFDYSNLGYGILGEVVAHVSKQPFDVYLQKNVFEPLGMKDSYLLSSNTYAKRKDKMAAVRYRSDSPYNRSPDVISYTAGGSGGYGSVHDVAAFAMFHLGHSVKNNKALIDTSVKYMQYPQVALGNGSAYGLAWSLDSNFYSYKKVMAQGGTVDALTYIELLPEEDIAVIVLSNSGNARAQQIINEALATILPNFGQQLALAAAAPAKQSRPVVTYLPDSSVGEWSGFIRTYKRDIPLLLSVTPAGKVIATINTGDTVSIINPSFRSQRLSFVAPGDLDIKEDAGTNAYNLHFYLTRRQDTFYGPVTTEGKGGNGARTPRLSYWVQLARAKK
jgi:CubicO group peptidase (beta-lactamase class C family)